MGTDFWREEGWSLRPIARKLQRTPSMLSRELTRNTRPNGLLYCPRLAQASRNTRRQAARPALKLAPFAGNLNWPLSFRVRPAHASWKSHTDLRIND
ncbi:helix-turn-helix domain-containing protein [Burkholderia pseudomallei]|uniref:helix-turn-helix domain-containing protein n=1 Tax=Burkholderia pseudomallei TaxID=28450 RepID=UPI0009780941|nr:helix-turn-helix domain-containing protein [Burkholderia pseudomallei]MCE2042347.1 helix-turn-helix domain-containing protein [Burkholderia pseudomallei CB]MBD2950542.1 helix-turn-helix domain-containing protein [Burkholderia pseudomallei]MBD2954653.1 helix-turn-helix domain-containing protein [Burkholderia pseudomallei]MBD2973011.1 helix-turn-helix domain-containing protein [Burkholderia pseudomallei]